MAFAGFKKPKDRADVVAYMKVWLKTSIIFVCVVTNASFLYVGCLQLKQ
jgi:hypothetical protein